jgi:hypothetical protein
MRISRCLRDLSVSRQRRDIASQSIRMESLRRGKICSVCCMQRLEIIRECIANVPDVLLPADHS